MRSLVFILSMMFSLSVFAHTETSERKADGRIPKQEAKEVLVVVDDALGQQYFSKVIFKKVDAEKVVAYDPHFRIQPGLYLITGTTDDDQFAKKLVIE